MTTGTRRQRVEMQQPWLHRSRRTATVSRPAIASTMSSEEHMSESVAPDDAVGSEAEGTPAPAAAPQDAGVKAGAEAAGETERGSSTYATGGGGVSFAHRVAT